MLHVTCIVGLPGSGKTYLARLLPHHMLLDDPQSLEQLPSIREGHIIITDPWFCRETVRMAARDRLREKYGANMRILWKFFENNPIACISNVKYRNDNRKVENLILSLTQEYAPPQNDYTVWQLNQDMCLPFWVPFCGDWEEKLDRAKWCAQYMNTRDWGWNNNGFEFASLEHMMSFKLAWM